MLYSCFLWENLAWKQPCLYVNLILLALGVMTAWQATVKDDRIQKSFLKPSVQGLLFSSSNLTNYGQIILFCTWNLVLIESFPWALNKDFPICIERDEHYNEYFWSPLLSFHVIWRIKLANKWSVPCADILSSRAQRSWCGLLFAHTPYRTQEKNQNVSWKGTTNREINSLCNLVRGQFWD